MASVVEDALASAEWIAAALTSSGYSADFAPPSLWEVDRFFDEQSEAGAPRAGGLLAEQLGQRIFALGSYTGEVIRRGLGGEWLGDDAETQAEINIRLQLADGTLIWPVQRAMKRYSNGAEDAIAAYGAALGLRVGPRP